MKEAIKETVESIVEIQKEIASKKDEIRLLDLFDFKEELKLNEEVEKLEETINEMKAKHPKISSDEWSEYIKYIANGITKTHYHEAAHLVFAVLIRKAEIEFPSPTYINVIESGNTLGAIDGGHVTHYATPDGEGQRQLKKLFEKSIDTWIGQLFFLLAGYRSSPAFYNGEQDACLHSAEDLQNKSDLGKSNLIAGKIVGNNTIDRDKYGGWIINSDCLELLEPIQDSIDAIIREEKGVRDTIQYVAEEVFNQYNEIKGKELEKTLKRVKEDLSEIDIMPYISKHVEVVRKLRESGVHPQEPDGQ